ncbi:MAG TPA: hypothetical protein VFS20_27375 [Longimicrobium sp.]|nr:hypothetical protein [Longimicrobium sp.]
MAPLEQGLEREGLRCFSSTPCSRLYPSLAHLQGRREFLLGTLNRLSHRSLGAILDSAERMVSRFSMSPRNAPDADEFSGTPQFQDKDGLHWVYREVKQPIWTPQGGELRPALELICLDDSALRGEVVFNDSDTMYAYLTMHGDSGVRELVPLVTREFQELEPDWM